MHITKKVLLCAVLGAVLFTFCSCGSKPNTDITVEKSEAMGEGKLPEQEEYSLSNERYTLVLNTDTTHFNLTDKKTGVRYSSIPDFECSIDADETKKRFVSEVSITYYDSKSASHYMCSTSDSVEMGGATVESDGERIRVTYVFGETNQNEFVPVVLTVEDYNDILEQLSRSQQRRFKLYYSLYSAENAPDDFEEKAKDYPAIKTTPLYLLSENIFETDRSNINTYMEAVGYTEEDYVSSVEGFEIPDIKNDTAGFTIPVEYSLDENGMTAKILTDLLTEQSENFRLASIELLPFFAAKSSAEDGFFLVPDGSGAIINMNSVSTGNYSQRIYGEDISLYKEEKNMLSERQTMPVFGMSSTNGTYLAVVEGASSMANINVISSSASNPANCAWVTFHYRIVEAEQNTELASSGSNAEGLYNIYQDIDFIKLPAVKYVFEESQITYSDMADTYRDYLVKQGNLKDSEEKSPVLIDFICGHTVEKTIMGISYTDTETLTTLSQIKEILNGLYDKGVENISVRLLGYSDEGIYHGANTNMSLHKGVGTKEELAELSKLVADHGGTLYLEADFQIAYVDKNGDHYSQRSDSAYYVNKKIVTVQDYHVVTRELMKEHGASFVSPNLYSDFAQMFLKDVAKQGLSAGVSYKNAGHLLGGDYSNNSLLGRDGAMQKVIETIAEAKQTGKVLVGGPNQYALSHADMATDVSIASSMFDIEKCTVPFWQLVFHGSIAYSAEAINLADNHKLHELKALEYGCGLHYTLTGAADEALLGQSIQGKYYSLSYKDWVNIIGQQYSSYANFVDSVAGVKMISHEQIAEDVYLTTYENGCYSVVNYGDNKFVGEDYSVKPSSYYLKGVK